MLLRVELPHHRAVQVAHHLGLLAPLEGNGHKVLVAHVDAILHGAGYLVLGLSHDLATSQGQGLLLLLLLLRGLWGWHHSGQAWLGNPINGYGPTHQGLGGSLGVNATPFGGIEVGISGLFVEGIPGGGRSLHVGRRLALNILSCRLQVDVVVMPDLILGVAQIGILALAARGNSLIRCKLLLDLLHVLYDIVQLRGGFLGLELVVVRLIHHQIKGGFPRQTPCG